jgi:hypothetical protein
MSNATARYSRLAICLALLSPILPHAAAAQPAAAVPEVLSLQAPGAVITTAPLPGSTPLMLQPAQKPGRLRVAAGTVGGGLLFAIAGAALGGAVGSDEGYILSERLVFCHLWCRQRVRHRIGGGRTARRVIRAHATTTAATAPHFHRVVCSWRPRGVADSGDRRGLSE